MTAPVFDPRPLAPQPPPRLPRPRPEREDGPAPSAKPDLRVLEPETGMSEADKARLVRLVVVVGVAVAALCLFGVVVFHVVLTQNQFRLDALQDQALQRQADYDRLRLQVAELESPDRIVADAQQRLGMVPAPKVTYLAPTIEEPTGATDAAPAEGDLAAGSSWSVVKPHLADG
jgi:cell division protein FtsL